MKVIYCAEPLASHSKSGMPLTKEFRLFFLDGELLSSLEYWEEGDYGGLTPPTSLFGFVAREVRSRAGGGPAGEGQPG